MDANDSEIRYDKVSTDFLSFCNGEHTFEEIISKIFEMYNLSDFDDDLKSSVKKKFEAFIQKQNELGILCLNQSRSECKVTFTGEREKYYPKRIVLELTNDCNCRCEHCFRNAGVSVNTLDIDVIENLLKYKGKIFEIQLTGGEPTFSPFFEKSIEVLSPFFKIIVMTNGTRLEHIRIDLLKKINFMQITLYGCDSESYIKTSKIDLFNEAFRGMKIVGDIGIRSQVAVIVNNENCRDLEKYINLAIKAGIKNIKFGAAAPIGRASNDKNNVWLLTDENRSYVDKKLKKLSEEYSSQIDVYTWSDDYVGKGNLKLHPHMPSCGAGYTHICITSAGYLKICQFLDDDFITNNISIDDIANNIHPSIDNIIRGYISKVKSQGFNPADICRLMDESNIAD